MDNRRLISALLVAMAVFMIYNWIIFQFYGRPTSQPHAETAVGRVTAPQASSSPALVGAPSASSPSPESGIDAALAFEQGDRMDPIPAGGAVDPQYPIDIVFTPRGGAIATLDLSAKRKNGQLIHRSAEDRHKPYNLLKTVATPENPEGEGSFRTHRVWIKEFGDQSWGLGQLLWKVSESSSSRVVFETALHSGVGDRAPVLRIRKTYSLSPQLPLIDLSLDVENFSGRPLTITLAHDGPIGIRREHVQYDMRRVVVGAFEDNAVSVASKQRGELFKGAELLPAGNAFAWVALTNKYFGVFTRLLPAERRATVHGGFVHAVDGAVADPNPANGTEHPGDLVARIYTKPRTLQPGERFTDRFEVYAGPKGYDELKPVNPDFVAHARLGYDLAQSADYKCMCTFEPLPWLMSELLRSIRFVVRNYGIAIIVLVIIIRSTLHPLTVFQQKSMYRMQEAMGKIQPRLADIKERFANDKVRMNQEMMKVWAEENINPAAPLLSMVPLFLQMPILVALWTALNNDVELRLAPFDGWWINDLSSPDALIRFSGAGLTIPILSWLPLIGTAFTNIPSINLLPLLMGVSMYLQQKYMPKPAHLQARLEAAKNQPPRERKPGEGMTPEEQLRQQQMIANMMSIMFPIMFYYMPSGLNLYWMATNVFGIFESLRIRKQLEREKLRRESEPAAAPAPRKKSFVSRMLSQMAEQAEDLQRKADKVSGKGRPGARSEDPRRPDGPDPSASRPKPVKKPK